MLDGLDGLFIDFYGTLAGGDRAAVERTCERIVLDFDLPTSAPEFAIEWGRVFFDTIARANGEGFRTLTDCERLSLVETLRPTVGEMDPDPYVAELTAYWRRPPLFDDARDLLDGLTIPVCCVSNVDTADLAAACEHHDLRFDRIVTSEHARSYKPDPEIFHRALAETGWHPARVVHVGDSLHSDVLGAHGAGLRAIWLHRQDRILDIGEAHPDGTILSLRELLGRETLHRC